jgi:tRNA A-37 threonylcarbamoyl transferase component Bud32
VKHLEISNASAPAADGSAGEPPSAGAPDDFEETPFGRYRLLRRIGKGGMAEAFLAVMEGAKGFRRKCVVKRIRPDKARSTYFAQMFVDEARITAALHHPNIVQIYEFGEVGGLYYLTMEYLDGRNLGALLDGLHAEGLLMPINMAAHVTQQVARGLHYAHELRDDAGRPLGVIHRDVSPTNVMLLRTGEVKILDFGVAKAERTLKQGATVVGKVKGKLSYMAPEQHSGKNVDVRADVFAAGVMLWEMLTGELLFSGAKGSERSRRLMRGDVPAPSSLRAKVPPELDAIVLRCLKVQPEDRYRSAGALAEALGSFVRASLFDPGELAALVTAHAADETAAPDTDSAGSGAPVVIDSHAILTREDAKVDQIDLDLMAATTARERRRPIIGPVPAPPPEAPSPSVDGAPPATAELTPGPAIAAPTAGPRWVRAWPLAVALAVAIAASVMLVPRQSETTAVNTTPARRVGAEITPVPVEPPPAPAEPAAAAQSPEPRSVDVSGPPRPASPKPAVTARRRGRAVEPPPRPVEEAAPAPPAATAPDGELRLVNPF